MSVRINIVGGGVDKPVEYPDGSNTEAVEKKLFGRFGQGGLEQNGVGVLSDTLASGDYEYHLTTQQVANPDLNYTVREEVKRQLHQQSSRKGSVTEAQVFHDMETHNKIAFDATFDASIHTIGEKGNFWVGHAPNEAAIEFPALKAGEKSTVQPFFDNILRQFNTIHTEPVTNEKHRLVYMKAENGSYSKATKLPVAQVFSVPQTAAQDNPSLGTRKPDVPCYFEGTDVVSDMRMVLFIELKPRSSTEQAQFAPAEMGQVICTAELLLHKQPQRMFAVVALSDGVRHQFFCVKRDGEDFKVEMSSIYLGMRGWAIIFGLMLTNPVHLGFMYFELQGWEFCSVLGRGAHSQVYAMKKDNVMFALKLFKSEDIRNNESNMLLRLAGLGNGPWRSSVPVVTAECAVGVREIMTQQLFYGIITLPVCVPIRPERAGVFLSRNNVIELLNCLHTVHAHHIINGDIKPKNVLVQVMAPANRAVICDWGSAVHSGQGDVLPVRRGGSIGYDDFSLVDPQVPSVASDLKAFVRTVYANFTDLAVPTDLNGALYFWTERFAPGSIWAEAMEAAEHGNHAALGVVLSKVL